MSPNLRKRLSREVSQQHTKQRLLDAAKAEVVRGGVVGASIRGICEAAGFSQGAFYSNFESRDDLLLQLMTQHVSEEAQTLRLLVAETINADFDATLRHLSERLAELSQTPEWSLLAVELQLYAQRDPAIAQRYEASKAAYHQEFANVVEGLVQRYGLEPALPSLQIAIGLYSLWLGLAAQGAVRGALPRGALMLAFFRATTGAPKNSANDITNV